MHYFIRTSFFLLVSLSLTAQISDLVKNQGVTSPMHQARMGQIVFTSRDVPPESLTETDLRTRMELTSKSSLFITAFMDNSITNYLHQLAPELSPDEIYTNGNLQFTFLVDNHIVYQENLNPGAGLPPRKDKETALSKPLVSYPDNIGWWSEFMWNRFKNNGGDKALTEGKHLFRMEIRPYVTLPELRVGKLVAAGEIELDVKKPVINIADIQLSKIKPYDGFPVSGESFDTHKIKELKGNIEEAVFRSITSVAVIKNGRLLIEEYFNGADRNTLHNTRSVGKSFASTMAGIAIEEGYIRNEDLALKEMYDLSKFDNYSAEKANTTIKDLLTMSSVFEGNDNDGRSAGNEENMYPADDWVKFTLNLPVDSVRKKGEWHYFTAGVVLLGDILHKKVPGGLEKYADSRLFKPLKISQYKWQHTPQGVANTAGGLQMNTLDFAKYGQLYKNHGRWNGRQVISKSWVDRTFSKQKPVPGRTDEYYGYLFWNKKYEVNGKSYETFYCTGNGGNKIFIFKDQPLVIVITATAYGAGYAHAQADKMMAEYILPAVINHK